jgi:4'-phosphopantetheinyl transferase
VHAWVLRWPHRSREGTGQLLAEAGARVLGTHPSELAASRDDAGQPVLRAAAGPLWASLSYGPDLLALAVSRSGPVGIDIEGPARPGMLRLADRWFDPAEALWLRSQPAAEQARSFLLLWTAKEALGKALGAGLRGFGLRRRVPLPPVADGSFQPAADGLRLSHPELGHDVVLAVAAAPGGRQVTIALEHDLDQPAVAGHPALARSAARSRTSLPVVVRGNWSKT